MRNMLKRKQMISFRVISILALMILVIPILIFFMGWMKIYWALLFSFLLCLGAGVFIKRDLWNNEKTIEIPIMQLLLIIIIFAIWVLVVGNCGVSVSNYDTKWRTAILRDLINYQWPVYFEHSDSVLSYYHIFWMVPAVIGKILGWHAALVAQWLWILAIIVVSFLLISFILEANNTKIFWIIAIGIVCWSGINILGSIAMDVLGINLYGFNLGMNEAYCDQLFNGESFNFYYRSNEDFLSNPYNQIVIWLAVPLMYENRKISNYAFIGLLLLPYTPWGVIGIAILMVIDALTQVKEYFRKKEVKKLFFDIFSIPNICAILSVLVAVGIYFKSNSRLSSTGASFGMLTLSKFDRGKIVGLIIFWLCEFGIYYMLLWKKYKKDKLFVWMLPVLMLIPLFWIGTISGRDFCMNVSLPALYLLMIYMLRYIKEDVIGKVISLKAVVLIVCLTLAIGTTVLDMAAKAKTIVENRSFIVQDDSFYSFADKDVSDKAGNQNFLNPDWRDQTFFKYFAKEVKVN